MSAGLDSDLELEIGHVLFIDVVGYSKLLIEEQKELQGRLTQIVRSTNQFRTAEAQGKLVRLPTGDGIALVFFTTPEAPVRCALEVSEALLNSRELQVRMGINTGPVSGTTDVNDRSNIAGAGINMAQRVMAFGDAGHILLSNRAAEDLLQYRHWQSHLHNLGEFEVKHGQKIQIVNLYNEKLGNPQLPQKVKQAIRQQVASRRLKQAAIAGLLLIVVALPTGSLILFHRMHPTLQSSVAAPGADKSIAVLPFENRSANQENSFFTDGVQDEILMHLAKIADLKVISRTSVMHYKNSATRNLREIAQQLGVAYILEGSVQRAANRIRVVAQLIDARTDTHIWANEYDRDLVDVFAIQSEIAKAIANQLQAKLSPGEKAAIEKPPTADLAAFDLYSRAKTLLLTISLSGRTRDILLQAVDLLNQAVGRDRKFFLAYSQLAFANDILYLINLDRTSARLAAGDAAVQAAVRLRPDSGEAHLVLAGHLYRAYLDYDRARNEIAAARRTLPNEPMVFELAALIDRRQGRWEESTRNFEREMELDPRNLYLLQQVALSYQYLRRYPEMAAVLDRALAISPKDVDTRVARAQIDLDSHADPLPLQTAINSILTEEPTAAPTLADTWLNLALCERDPASVERVIVALSTNNFRVDAVLWSHSFIDGLLARVRGDTAAARAAFTTARAQQEELVRTQQDYAPPLCMLGLIDAGLGHKEDALREGRRAVELLPVERDAINGAHMIEFFAIICAWTGEKDLALEQLTSAVRLPGWLSYGLLRLHPIFDPLRGDPRFETIVDSLAPQDTSK
jgi:TolB-like protein/class 3 adenylate cyclase